MNFSFAGCGFMGVYHLGVARCLQTYAPHVLVNKVGDKGLFSDDNNYQISGASAGSCVALALLTGSAMGDTFVSLMQNYHCDFRQLGEH